MAQISLWPADDARQHARAGRALNPVDRDHGAPERRTQKMP